MEYLLDIAALLAGGGVLYFGFSQWRRKRLMENIPTSRAGSVAMGFAEVSGEAYGEHPLKSPVTFAPCVYYRFRIEKLEYSTNNERRRWVVAEEGSSDYPFFLKDGTGKILVDPAGAELLLDPDYRYRDDAAGMKYTEWKIMLGDRIYVLGTVRGTRDRAADRRERLIEGLREVKKDRERLASYDADRDGEVSVEEWERLKGDMEAELLRDDLSRKQEEEWNIIAKSAGHPFVISNRSEKELAQGHGIKALLGLSGGFVLTMVMAASLLSHAGMLPGYLAFPWGVILGIVFH